MKEVVFTMNTDEHAIKAAVWHCLWLIAIHHFVINLCQEPQPKYSMLKLPYYSHNLTRSACVADSFTLNKRDMSNTENKYLNWPLLVSISLVFPAQRAL